MENFNIEKFKYNDDRIKSIDVSGGQTASFGPNEFTVSGENIETLKHATTTKFHNSEAEDSIAEKNERTFSSNRKHKNNRDYIDKINRYVKSMFGKNAKTNGNIRERGNNPLK